MRILLAILLIQLLDVQVSHAEESAVTKIGEIGHGPISEVSGIVKSQRYPDTYWVHNDSGDSPRLFAISGGGEVIVPPFVKNKKTGPGTSDRHWPGMPVYMAANQDWEDIALHGGMIYIADVGNNGNARRDLGIYVVREPNPKAITNARSLNYYPIEFPDQAKFPAEKWHFDIESLFVDAGVPYFITKHRQPGKISDWERGAKLYRLDSFATDRVNQLTLVGMHDEVAVATAADLSPDGNWLAVLCYTTIWLFERPASGDDWFSGESHKLDLNFQQTGQVEAIAWKDDDTLIFTNEPGELFEVYKSKIVVHNQQ